jgi:hypothetical protein
MIDLGRPSVHTPKHMAQGWSGMESQVRVGSHGVPSPTRLSLSQHGGKVPTFEPREIIKRWLVIT